MLCIYALKLDKKMHDPFNSSHIQRSIEQENRKIRGFLVTGCYIYGLRGDIIEKVNMK